MAYPKTLWGVGAMVSFSSAKWIPQTPPNSQPQTARKAPSHTRTHPERKAPKKDKRRRDTTSQPTPPTMGDPTTAHPIKRKHRQQSRQRWTCTRSGRPPPAKSKRKAPRRTGAHDVIFLMGPLEDFTQQNERKKNNAEYNEHCRPSLLYAKIKRFVSVVLVYCATISGCPFFNAAVSIRELVTVL